MDKNKLFSRRIAEDDVEIPGVGTVRIRALSREEALAVRDKRMPIEQLERKVLSAAMVDPKLTADEVAQWQAASSAGEIERVMHAILELSGMKIDDRPDKEAYQQFRG